MRTIGVIFLIAASALTGCVRSYNLRLANESQGPVTVELTQYRAKDFTGDRPAKFTDELKLRASTKSVPLAPGQEAMVQFSDAAGGFWVQWCPTEGRSSNECGIVDLIRDRREVNIK